MNPTPRPVIVSPETMTPREVDSFIESFRMGPWGEEWRTDEIADYLGGIHSAENGSVLAAQETDLSQPYLYFHTVKYGSDIDTLVESEFGIKAMYSASDSDKDKIKKLVGSKGQRHNFISNIHADLEVAAEHNPQILKPRLRVLPDVLEILFQDVDAVSMFTHGQTGVANALRSQEFMKGFDVDCLEYSPIERPPSESLNELHAVDVLIAVVITRQ